MSELDILQLTVAVLPDGLVIALEHPLGDLFTNRISLISDYIGLPSAAGVYRAEVSPMRQDFRVNWYEPITLVPTGEFVYPLSMMKRAN